MTTKTNEPKVVLNAWIGNREMSDMIAGVARKMLDTGCEIPEEFADIFSITISTRPSGEKFAVVNFV